MNDIDLRDKIREVLSSHPVPDLESPVRRYITATGCGPQFSGIVRAFRKMLQLMLFASAAQTPEEYVDRLAEVLNQFTKYESHIGSRPRLIFSGEGATESSALAYNRIIQTLFDFESLFRLPTEEKMIDLSWLDCT